MKIVFSKSFENDYSRLLTSIKEITEKQLLRLLDNYRHPSLHSKKIKGTSKFWEIRVTNNYRLTFEIQNDIILLRRIGTYDILKREKN